MLLNNKWFGKIIIDYYEKKSVPLRAKIFSIIFLWLAIGFSIIYLLEDQTFKIILIGVGVAVTVHLIVLKASNDKRENSRSI